jgi:hypothetical protein
MLCEPWPRSGRLLRHFWFFPPDAAQPNQSERVSRRGPIACHGEGAERPGLDAGANGDYLASPSKEEKTPQQAACRHAAARFRTEENARQDQAGILVASRGNWPCTGPRQHTARPVKDHLNNIPLRPGRGLGAPSLQRVRVIPPARTRRERARAARAVPATDVYSPW